MNIATARIAAFVFAALVVHVQGRAAQDLPGQPEKPATVEGMVTNPATGDPVSGMRITFTEEGGASRNVTTDKTGKFQARDLPPGRYSITLFREGFAYRRRPADLLNLSLLPGARVDGLHFQVVPTGVVSGRIYDENNRPRTRVAVELLRYAYVNGQRVLTVVQGRSEADDRGEYRLSNIEPGDYYIRVSGNTTTLREDGGFAAVYYPGVADPQYASAISVKPGAELSAIDFGLTSQNVFTVRLKVLLPPNVRSPAMMRFHAVPRDRKVIESSLGARLGLSGGGSWFGNGFLPGTHDIYVYTVVSFQPEVVLYGRTVADVIDRDVDAGTVSVSPGVDVRGRLTLPDKLPPAMTPSQIRLTLRPLDNMPSTYTAVASVADDGTFTIPNVAEGRFEVSMAGVPRTLYLESAQYGGRDVLRTGLSVTRNASGSLDLVAAGPGGRIDGVVRNTKDEPIRGSRVVLIPPRERREMNNAYRVTFSDQMGVFRFTGVAPGEYSILAWEDVEAGAYQNAEFLREFENRARKIIVEQGSRQTLDVKVIQ